MSKLYQWLHTNAIITILSVVWTMVLVSWVVWRVFGTNPPNVPASTAAALATVFGLPTLAFGLWKWRVDDKTTSK